MDHALRKAVVLVVEDEPLMLLNAVEALEDAGFDVVHAPDGDTALEIFSARGDIRAIFTDINMPGATDGLALARLAVARRPDVGILVTSGALHPRLQDMPKASRFVTKPYRFDAVVTTLVELIGGSPSAARACG